MNIFKKATIVLSFGFLFLNFQSNAQIIYTDINPDGVPTNGGFNFDQTGPNEIDVDNYGVLSYSGGGSETNIWANGTANSGWDVPKPITVGTTIDATGNFIGYGDASMDNWGGGTPFPLNTDAYIAVRLKIGSGTFYGWIRVMWDGTSFVYKDYAYESTPNKSIKAGEKAVPTNLTQTDFSNQVNVFPNPATTQIHIQNNSQESIENAIVFDIFGHTIQSVNLSQHNQTLNVSNLTNGIYFISFYNQNRNISTQKFVIAR
ncbi:MAG TPA: T9SS type A sorting domain-containing protein [Chitinophagaceae bacterium]|nr:T9SS type A sorting domain-containing protein [Chitinophagaceae bacterium]